MIMTLSIGDDYLDVQISLYSARESVKGCVHMRSTPMRSTFMRSTPMRSTPM